MALPLLPLQWKNMPSQNPERRCLVVKAATLQSPGNEVGQHGFMGGWVKMVMSLWWGIVTGWVIDFVRPLSK